MSAFNFISHIIVTLLVTFGDCFMFPNLKKITRGGRTVSNDESKINAYFEGFGNCFFEVIKKVEKYWAM